MRPVRSHRPGEPATDSPPDRLVDLAELIRHPLVHQTGVTSTSDGRWAVFVTVPKDSDVPIREVESQAEGFPVVYEAEPEEPPRAGPARPARK